MPEVTVSELIRSLRDLVLHHPHLAEVPVTLCPHGQGHRQLVESIHTNLHETCVVLEAKRN